MQDLGHWHCDISIPESFYGFVYEITNLITNKVYIGKKQSVFRRKKALRKGKKKREIVIKESDWKTYTGSNNELNKDIAQHGKEKFSFKILRFCDSKWQLAYYEIEEQIKRGVLLSENYYNGIINCRLGRPKQKTVDKHIE